MPQEELRSLKEGEVRERTPARPPQRSFGPRRFGQALFGQRAGGRDGPLLPSIPPRSYGKFPPMPSGPPGSPGGAGSVLQQVLTFLLPPACCHFPILRKKYFNMTEADCLSLALTMSDYCSLFNSLRGPMEHCGGWCGSFCLTSLMSWKTTWIIASMVSMQWALTQISVVASGCEQEGGAVPSGR